MELTLTRHGAQIQVQVDGSDSHAFPENALEFSADDPLATQYDPQPYGARLYGALFPPTSLAARELAGKPDALLLVMEDADLQRVPWEYLFDGKNYLAVCLPINASRFARTGATRAMCWSSPATRCCTKTARPSSH
jgi:hypothetical protein